MQAIRRFSGEVIDYTPVGAVSAGDVVLIGSIPLPAMVDIAAGTKDSLAVEGVFDVAKTTDTFTAGDAVYWNTTADPVGGSAGTGAAKSSAAGSYLMGLAVADAVTGDATVRVLLTAAKRTATIAGSVTADDITGSDSSLGIAGLAATQGGAIVVAGGASAGSNNNGGAVSVNGGAKNGTGTNGAVNLGASNTSIINLGAASIPTAIIGPEKRTVGVSTAAAGTTTSDAGVLPAGTASVYPTTAADDAAGVRVHASDKVTGTLIFIGNGVSNKILKVYAPSGGTINGGSADAAFSSVSGKGVIIYCLSSGSNTWLAW